MPRIQNKPLGLPLHKYETTAGNDPPYFAVRETAIRSSYRPPDLKTELSQTEIRHFRCWKDDRDGMPSVVSPIDDHLLCGSLSPMRQTKRPLFFDPANLLEEKFRETKTGKKLHAAFPRLQLPTGQNLRCNSPTRRDVPSWLGSEPRRNKLSWRA